MIYLYIIVSTELIDTPRIGKFLNFLGFCISYCIELPVTHLLISLKYFLMCFLLSLLNIFYFCEQFVNNILNKIIPFHGNLMLIVYFANQLYHFLWLYLNIFLLHLKSVSESNFSSKTFLHAFSIASLTQCLSWILLSMTSMECFLWCSFSPPFVLHFF